MLPITLGILSIITGCALTYIIICIKIGKPGYMNTLKDMGIKRKPQKHSTNKTIPEEQYPCTIENNSHRCVNIHTSYKHVITIKPRESINTILKKNSRLTISVGECLIEDQKLIKDNTTTYLETIKINDSETYSNSYQININKFISLKQRIIKIVSDPHWFMCIKYNPSISNCNSLSFSAIKFDDGDIKDPYKYVSGISHILTPNGKLIDFRNVSEGVTGDGFKFSVFRTSFNHVDVIINQL
jgi:hypothetical protein